MKLSLARVSFVFYLLFSLAGIQFLNSPFVSAQTEVESDPAEWHETAVVTHGSRSSRPRKKKPNAGDRHRLNQREADAMKTDIAVSDPAPPRLPNSGGQCHRTLQIFRI